MATTAASEPGGHPAKSRRPLLALLALIVVLGGGLRFFAALTDFWLDEIWSWQISGRLTQPWQVFFVHQDNNHYLNTLRMYLLGDRPDWLLYRLPSVVAGTATIACLGLIGMRRGAFQAVALTALAASSFCLALYSSEARGYALAIFFAVVCMDQLERHLQDHKPRHEVLFALAAALGLLSHLSFLFVYSGIVAWWMAGLYRQRQPLMTVLRHGVLANIVPAAVFAALYFVDIRHQEIGGGPVYSPLRVIGDLISSAYGASYEPWSAILFVVLTALLVVYACVRPGGRQSGLWVLYVVSLLLAPAALIWLHPVEYLYPRYFVVCLPVLLLLLTEVLAALCTLRGGKLISATLLVLLCLGNGVEAYRFFQDGRGHYLAALQYIAANTRGPSITLSGDQDFRTQTTIAYYRRFLPSDKPIQYFPGTVWPLPGPEWLLLSTQAGDQPPAGEFRISNDLRYRLARTYPCSARFSGFDWYVYHRAVPGN